MDSTRLYRELKINILDCDGNVTDQPMIHIKSTAGGNDLYSFLSGEINAWIPVCPSFQLTAYDLESGVEGPLMNWSTNIDDDFSYMTSCNNNDDGFAVIKIGGERQFFSAFAFEYSGEKSILKSTDNAIRFAVEGDDTGSFEEKLVNIYINDETFGSKGFFMDCENAENGCGINDCTITHYDVSADGWIRVSFSGNMWMRTIDPVVAGYFDVEGVIMVKN